MKCIKCGNIVNDNEKFCPNCGTKIMKNNNELSSVDENELEEGSNPIIYLSIIFLIIIFLGAIIVNVTGIDNLNTSGKIEDINKNYIEYDGYKFYVPDKFKSSISKDYGVVMKNDNYSFNIKVDSYNSYDEYLSYFKKEYPSYSDSLEFSIDKKSFAGILYDTSSMGKVAVYVSTIDDGVVVTGMIKNTNGVLDNSMFNTLAKIFSSTKFSYNKKSATKSSSYIIYYIRGVNMTKIGKILKIILIICTILFIPIVIIIPYTIKAIVFSNFIIYPNSIIMLLIDIQFIKLFKSLEEDNPFCKNNILILRRASIYSFIMTIFWIIDSLILYFLCNCTYINYYIVIAFLIVLFFGVGVALYILSKLFSKAYTYKEENDLTI